MVKSITSSLLILCCGAFASFNAAADDATTPEVTWAKLFCSNTAGDMPRQVLFESEDNIYWFGTLGSDNTNPYGYFGDEIVCIGGPYSGNSYNYNFSIIKTDAAGNLKWNIYSNSGDISTSEGWMGATSDGGIIVAAKVRHTSGYLTSPIRFVDGFGQTVDIDWSVEYRHYQMILLKISADGEIEWTRRIEVSADPQPEASSSYAAGTAESIYVTSVAVDEDDNFYVSGNYRNPVTFVKDEKTTVTIKPNNTSGWTGDSQNTVGDLYVVKFDKDGYYLNSITTTGYATAERIDAMEYVDGWLYIFGYIRPEEGSTVSFDGIELDPQGSTYQCPFAARLDSDLNADWVKLMIGDSYNGSTSVTFQNFNVAVDGNDLYLVFMHRAKVMDNESDNYITFTSTSTREGAVILLDASTGKWINATSSFKDFNETGAITGYFGVFTDPDMSGKFYAFGYEMTGSVGAFVRTYDRDSFEAVEGEAWNIVTSTYMPSVYHCAYDSSSKTLFINCRDRGTLSPMGSDETYTTLSNQYGGLYAAFKMPFSATTGIKNAAADDSNSLKVYGTNGAICIVAPTNDVVPVYDVAGRTIAIANVVAGENYVTVPAGVYIAANTKVIVK